MDRFTDEDRLFFKQSPLFTSLQDDQFEQLIKLARQVNYNTGDVLLTEGECSDSIFIVIKGSVDLYKNNKIDKVSNRVLSRQLIATMQVGQSLGEMRLVQDMPSTLTAEAAEPTLVAELSIKALRSPEYNDCFRGLLSAIILIQNNRLLSGNVNFVTSTNEKTKKMKQLSFTIFITFIIAIVLFQTGAALYYMTHTEDFCSIMKPKMNQGSSGFESIRS